MSALELLGVAYLLCGVVAAIAYVLHHSPESLPVRVLTLAVLVFIGPVVVLAIIVDGVRTVRGVFRWLQGRD